MKHLLLLLLLLLAPPPTRAAPPTHAWGTAQQGQFIDFGYSCPAADRGKCVGKTPFTPARAKAIAHLYPIISIEKCAGADHNTEVAIWESAKLVRLAASFPSALPWHDGLCYTYCVRTRSPFF